VAGNLAIERLLVTRRGRKDLRWAAKEAAVAIGCHSITFSVAPGFPRTMRRQASGWNSRANRLHDLESVQHVREHRRQACEVEEGALARCVLVERSARNPRSPRTKDESLKRLSESAGRTLSLGNLRQLAWSLRVLSISKEVLRMRSLVTRPPQWCFMATVEVADHAPDLAEILADLDFAFRLEPAAASPPNVRWFNLLVDARRGERRCGYTAHKLLSALQRIAASGELPGFRIIVGERWLDGHALGLSIALPTEPSSATPGPTARHG
jgi:hypothetical protein